MVTVVGLFKDIYKVDSVVQALKSYAFSSSQISVEPHQLFVIAPDIELKTAKDEITMGIWVGAVVGATMGLLVGTIGSAQITTFLSLVGVVLTPGHLITLLISTAVGTGICAVAGSLLLTGLIKLGFYAQKAKPDGLFVSVQTPEERVSEVKSVFHKVNAIDVSIEN